METGLPSCGVCYNDFDLTRHLPRILPDCGHTLCSKCLSTILNSENTSKCPQDRTIIDATNKTLESFPINLVVKEILESQNREDICQLHHEKKKYLCMTDKELICADCAVIGDHVGHDTKPIKQLEAILQRKAKTAGKAIEKLKNYHENASELFSKLHSSFANTITHRFEEMRWALQNREARMKLEIHNLFCKNNIPIAQQLFLVFPIIEKLKRKVKEYNQPVTYDSITNLVGDSIDDIVPELYSDNFQVYLQEFDKVLSQSVEKWDETLKQQIQAILDIRAPEQDISDLYLNLLKGVTFQPPEEDWTTKPTWISVRTNIESTVKDGTLTIGAVKDWELGVERKHIDLEELHDVRNVVIDFRRDPYRDKSVEIIHHLLSPIEAISSFRVTDHCLSKISKEIFTSILFHLLHHAYSVRDLNLELSVSKVIIDNQTTSLLLEHILPRMIRLESLTLDLNSSKTPNHILSRLGKHNTLLFQHLKKFKLVLDFVESFTDEGLRHIFIPMKSITAFSIGLIETKITDETLFILGGNMLPYCPQLISIDLSLNSTAITDKSLIHLLANMPRTLEKLDLGLGQLDLTSRFFKALGEYLFDAKHLRGLVLDLTGCRVEDEDIEEIWIQMSSLETFGLYISETAITDETLHKVSETLLHSAGSLTTIKIHLENVEITDDGVIDLFDGLWNLRCLDLNLMYTEVTNAFGEKLVNVLLPNMPLLEELGIYVEGTKMSYKMRNKIKEYQERLNKLRGDESDKI